MYHQHLKRRLARGLSGLLAGAASVGSSVVPGASGPTFSDVTAAGGVRVEAAATTMESLPEALGSGAVWLDYDQDGWLDIYALGGGSGLPEGVTVARRCPRRCPGCHESGMPASGAPVVRRSLGAWLLRNGGDGSFADVTERSGTGAVRAGRTAVSADYDGDGWPDLYVLGLTGNTLLRNRGDGTFADATEAAGVGCGRWSTGAAFLDYDKDGDLDLFVTNYVDFDPYPRSRYEGETFSGPLHYPAQANVLYRNNGDGTFSDVTASAGVGRRVRGLGVIAFDADGDGWMDLFVASDGGRHQLYRNNGNGTFGERAGAAGVGAGAHGGLGLSVVGDVGDYDRDGLTDLLTGGAGYAAFFRQTAAGRFDDVAVGSGLGKIRGQFQSWGTRFLDFDNDGYLDVLGVSGSRENVYGRQIPFLAQNVAAADGQRAYRDASLEAGPWFAEPRLARGLAVADFDNDGDEDAFATVVSGLSVLLRNETGSRGNWLTLRLRGAGGNRDAIGARVSVRAGGLVQIAERASGTGFLSQGDPRLHFGLGPSTTVDEIRIVWPSGRTQVLKDQTVNRIATIEEPAP